jgi:subtilisin family serine protease
MFKTSLAALTVFASVLPALAAPPVKGEANPLGIVMVKFKRGTSAAQARSAVTAAGGQIVTDLSASVRTIAAVPSANGFANAIAVNASVESVWADRLSVRIPRTDAGPSDATGKNQPALGNPGITTPPDPWHNATSFAGESNPEGILQWDDNRMNVPAAWATTLGDRTVRVAVLDTGVQGSHKELLPNYDNQTSANMIPCNLLTRQFGLLGQKDCSSEDMEGHGTWVASRIAGAVNGFASNGIAPRVQIIGCNHNVDIINMSLGGYDHPVDNADDYLLWVDAVNYCRSKGTAIFASAGNEHVRVNRVNMSVGGSALVGVGQVDGGNEGIATVIPGDSLSNSDLRGLLETPAGVPGVIMVSATGNAIGAGAPPTFAWYAAAVGARDQLTYYSSYGSRVDITAPGGARKFNIPRYDAGNGDILYGGWGSLGALDPSGEICTDPGFASPLVFFCFKVQGAGFGWLQGTSMSSPNAAGVGALTLSAHPELRGNPAGLLTRLQSTARTNMVNLMGPNDPTNFADSLTAGPCPTGFCHIVQTSPISFGSAYGAGMVNAGAAVAP